MFKNSFAKGKRTVVPVPSTSSKTVDFAMQQMKDLGIVKGPVTVEEKIAEAIRPPPVISQQLPITSRLDAFNQVVSEAVESNQVEMEDQKRVKMMWIGLGLVGVVAAYMIMKK